MGDDLVEEGTPVGVGDADVGMVGALFGWDSGEFGVEPLAAVAKKGDMHGQEGDHKAARAESVEGVNLVFFVEARVSVVGVVVVEASGKKKRAAAGSNLRSPDLRSAANSATWYLHAETEQDAVAIAVSGDLWPVRAALTAKLRPWSLGMGISVVGEGNR